MGRHRYSDDVSEQQAALWRGRVMSAIRGRRGQRLLRDLRDALDDMTDKRLLRGELQDAAGEACALGVVAMFRGIAVDDIDVHDEWSCHHGVLSDRLDIAKCLAQEIEYQNDDGGPERETPEQRHGRMLAWVEKHIKAEVVS